MSRLLICTVLLALFGTLFGSGPTAMVLAGGPVMTLVVHQDLPTPLDAPGPRPLNAPDVSGRGEFGRGEFGWPLPGSPAVIRGFRAPPHPYGSGHRGVDLAGQIGTPVLAASAGTVVFAGHVAGRAVISIDHPGGVRTTYQPVSPTVAAGDLVAMGEQIGTLQAGHLGCPLAACLHWGARRGMDYLDPLRLLGLTRLRLLPWEGSSREV